jgi:hypothetical protein
MGDRCNMYVTVRDSDLKRFMELTEDYYSFSVWDEDTNTTELLAEEINFGNTDDLPKDIPFIGHHYQGFEYGPAQFACDGQGKFGIATTGHDSSGFPIDFDDEGNPKQEQIEFVRAFLLLHKKVKALLEAPVETKSDEVQS